MNLFLGQDISEKPEYFDVILSSPERLLRHKYKMRHTVAMQSSIS